MKRFAPLLLMIAVLLAAFPYIGGRVTAQPATQENGCPQAAIFLADYVTPITVTLVVASDAIAADDLLMMEQTNTALGNWRDQLNNLTVPDCLSDAYLIVSELARIGQDELAAASAMLAEPGNAAEYSTLLDEARAQKYSLLANLSSALAALPLDSGAPSTAASDPTAPAGDDWYRLYFTEVINSEDEGDHTGSALENALIFLIDNTQESIDAALFELNVPGVTDALIRAAERGVTIRMVVDDEHAYEDPESTIESVIDAGAEVVSDERSALMHNKFFIFDASIVWTGSTNITRNDIYNNNNHGMAFVSPELVEIFQTEFNSMFEEGQFSRRDNPREEPFAAIDISGTRVEVFFSPNDGDFTEARLEELISEAEESIRVMAFNFTLEPLGTALIERHNAGVDVAGVFEVTGSLQGQMPCLYEAGIPVRQDGNSDILHHKVIIIDEEIVVMGSLNFSASARDNNSENTLILFNPDIAAQFLAEWQHIYDAGRVPDAEDVEGRCD